MALAIEQPNKIKADNYVLFAGFAFKLSIDRELS